MNILGWLRDLFGLDAPVDAPPYRKVMFRKQSAPGVEDVTLECHHVVHLIRKPRTEIPCKQCQEAIESRQGNEPNS